MTKMDGLENCVNRSSTFDAESVYGQGCRMPERRNDRLIDWPHVREANRKSFPYLLRTMV